jgi:hypothetical protein
METSQGDELADLTSAIREFETALPGWWYSVCKCSVSADACCGPDRQLQDAWLLKDRQFDNGFNVAFVQPATMAEALREVMVEALAARAEKIKSTSTDPKG